MPEQPDDKYLVHLFRKEVEQSDEVKLQYEIERRSAAREKPPRKMTYQDLMDMCKLFLADQLKHKTEKQYDARHEPQPQASAATERVAGLAPRSPRKPHNACPYWVKYGRCNKMDDGCPYEHNEADRLSAPAPKGKAKAKARAKSTPPTRDRTPPPPTPLDDAAAQRLARQPRTGKSADGTVAEAKICTFYLHQKAGNCRSGSSCKFHHPPDCKDHKKGHCEFGKKCRYHHVKSTPAASAAVTEDEAEPAKEEASPKAKTKAKAKQAQSAVKKQSGNG